MEEEFWVDSWAEGGSRTSFHLRRVHPHAELLAERVPLEGRVVLVPLCGKSVDLLFFAERAERVVGVELVGRAVEEFFAENGLSPTEVDEGVFTAGNLTIRNQSLFDLGRGDLGRVDVVYDRAALIAFPEAMRGRYVAKILELATPGTRYFLNTLEYRPSLDSPPFSVGPEEVAGYYGEWFDIEHWVDEVQPGHRMVEKFGLEELREHGFLLRRR
ncbi:thiopurine S-methyltransferase [Actinosynnema pretiosum]|uniref:thiopurine S-methyltransferase n=2 Tax=Actinosynnema TaxID=40566 RepID=A0A290Z412_9PSEU|nr:thiopurine S-methyltransferase [Actinosynnema pretiosum]ATE53747.1 thiopurine S-methyltransferase [Actinosynnema pretiosum]